MIRIIYRKKFLVSKLMTLEDTVKNGLDGIVIFQQKNVESLSSYIN